MGNLLRSVDFYRLYRPLNHLALSPGGSSLAYRQNMVLTDSVGCVCGFACVVPICGTDWQTLGRISLLREIKPVVFGSGLAIVPFLHGGVVESHQWLNERQFLNAI